MNQKSIRFKLSDSVKEKKNTSTFCVCSVQRMRWVTRRPGQWIGKAYSPTHLHLREQSPRRLPPLSLSDGGGSSGRGAVNRRRRGVRQLRACEPRELPGPSGLRYSLCLYSIYSIYLPAMVALFCNCRESLSTSPWCDLVHSIHAQTFVPGTQIFIVSRKVCAIAEHGFVIELGRCFFPCSDAISCPVYTNGCRLSVMDV